MSQVKTDEKEVELDVAEVEAQPSKASKDVNANSSDPSDPSDPSKPTQAEPKVDEPPAQLPPTSITEPHLDMDLPNPHSDPQPETGPPPSLPLDPKTPRQWTDGVEKNDWEVVNASPSHSPSKDTENQNQLPKTKGREREKSANSTFGKDGKFVQKIDGVVQKVFKSGFVGGSESHSPIRLSYPTPLR